MQAKIIHAVFAGGIHESFTVGRKRGGARDARIGFEQLWRQICRRIERDHRNRWEIALAFGSVYEKSEPRPVWGNGEVASQEIEMWNRRSRRDFRRSARDGHAHELKADEIFVVRPAAVG